MKGFVLKQFIASSSWPFTTHSDIITTESNYLLVQHDVEQLLVHLVSSVFK